MIGYKPKEDHAVRPPSVKDIKTPYEKEDVQHLVDILLTLQQAYEDGIEEKGKEEILTAMKTVNKSIETRLKPQWVLRGE